MSETDRIEKSIFVCAPIEKVWRAISDSQEFGKWFGMRVAGPFVAGQPVASTIVEPPGYEHLAFQLHVEAIEAPRLFSFRWHPGAIEPGIDYTHEPMTLVTFALTETPEGTQLSLSEAGFDALPEHRRASAFRLNDGGWTLQTGNVKRYVEAVA